MSVTNNKSPSSATTTNDNSSNISSSDNGGIYDDFAKHAWDTLQSNNLRPLAIPSDLSKNNAPTKGGGNNIVAIEVKALSSSSSGHDKISQNNDHREDNDNDNVETASSLSDAVRLARYALLRTTPDEKLNGIHVLNLVIFPHTSLRLPVFGADLVSLPGNKHLIAIDFQPIEKLEEGEEEGETVTESGVITPVNDELSNRLIKLHETHVVNNSRCLPWGGDIPSFAKRFFSPYALWTRLNGMDAVDLIETKVRPAFDDYLDLYIDMLKEAVKLRQMKGDDGGSSMTVDMLNGQNDYLAYRRDNDPARPMLRSLYGEEWTERLINEILFKKL